MSSYFCLGFFKGQQILKSGPQNILEVAAIIFVYNFYSVPGPVHCQIAKHWSTYFLVEKEEEDCLDSINFTRTLE